MIELKPEGSNGRPAKSYWLTKFGAAVLNMLPDNLEIRAPNIRDPSDLAHRYITLKIAERAKKDGLEPMVEHRLSNSVQEVRADIYTELDDIPLVIEVEQKLLRQHLRRAQAKLVRWARFIQAENSDERWSIQLVFNIRPREEPTLVRYWKEAFHEAQKEFGELPYDLYYINARDLLEPPSFLNALHEAELFIDETLYANERNTEREPDEARPEYISEDTLFSFQEALDNLLGAPPDRSLIALTELGLLIHTASYYPNSPSLKAAVFPHASIWLLHRYLNDPRMGAVKTELRQSLTRIHKRNPGMVMLRETVTGLLWDVLLFHHGLGRGGPLQVVFQIPDFQDRSSDFRVEVRLSDDLREKYTEEAKALGWCLGGIYLYRRHLGLIEEKKRS